MEAHFLVAILVISTGFGKTPVQKEVGRQVVAGSERQCKLQWEKVKGDVQRKLPDIKNAELTFYCQPLKEDQS